MEKVQAVREEQKESREGGHVKISSHLRDFHGYSLAESVKWSPREMLKIHEEEHVEKDCGHPVDHVETKR